MGSGEEDAALCWLLEFVFIIDCFIDINDSLSSVGMAVVICGDHFPAWL